VTHAPSALDPQNAPRLAAVIVLAAGEGTRMKSPTLPKVLHSFAGRSMIAHVLAATSELGAEHDVVVVGHAREAVTAHVAQIAPAARCVVQEEQRGTGHAVRIALSAVPADAVGTVLVLPGDTPLLEASTLAELLAAHDAAHAAVTLLTSVLPDPSGYGRILRDESGAVTGVVEHKDANTDQLAITEIASGMYAFDHDFLRDAVGRLSTDNAQGEEYLPDVVRLAVEAGLPVRAVITSADQTAGVNDRVQLADAHRVYNRRLIEAHMRNGVTVLDPATTWVDAGVRLEVDATLLPGVQLHGTTHVATGASIGPDSTLTDTTVGARSRLQRVVAVKASIGADVTVGPYAYLRPGTVLGDEVHIGTYVEIKGSDIGVGSKVPHLSYVGDATIGEHTNIGAATVFVNYDGVQKHRSVIGDHARTGADNMFVAPVQVGDGAYTAAGSIITEDVPPGSMGVARARQVNLAGWVASRRAGTPADEAAQRAIKAIQPVEQSTQQDGTQP
jgi:bifunctional UDP-N-acetylglucosamine pyrophosphorylase/glucosamine-1-phosphate N-acetyltransferase